MSENDYVFYQPLEIPKKWTLYDALLWVALRKIPEALYDDDATEMRESTEFLYDDMFSWGERFVVTFEENETKFMGMKKSPEIVLYELEKELGDSLLTPEFYRRPFQFDDPELQARHDADFEKMLPKAEGYDAYKIEWQEALESYFDEYCSQLHICLKAGKLRAEGLFIESAENNEWYNAGHAIFEDNNRKLDELYKKIPPQHWLSKGINWKGSYLNFRESRYFAIRFSGKDVLKAFPLEKRGSQNLFRDGVSIFTTNEKKQTPRSKIIGRPSKNWDAINLRIAEIIKHEGHLPEKQDALAQDLVDWYQSEFRQSIGLSTVKSRLKPYYSAGTLQKSGK